MPRAFRFEAEGIRRGIGHRSKIHPTDMKRREQTWKRLDIHPRHALRLLNTAKAECQDILGIQSGDDFVGDLNGAADSEAYDNVVCIQAADAGSDNGLVRMVEAYDSAITVAQLARILQCSKREIYSLIEQKRLPALKVGTMMRLDPASVCDWIRGKMTIAA